MLTFTHEERQEVIDYYLGQSPEGAKVSFAQKVYTETVIGHTHAVWDLHGSDGRWWVITNPTNLYSQDQFPNMDLVVTFHMGLCLRIPRNDVKKADIDQVRPFTDVMQYIADCGNALAQADDAGAFKAVGVRCRETLLSFIHVTQDACEWPDIGRPQRSNFKAWVDLIFDTFLAGADNKERRRIVKVALTESWDYMNWLTHSRSGRWIDAEIAVNSLSYSLGLATAICIRHLRGVPPQCPACGSSNLWPEQGMNEEHPEITIERPMCVECGWRGEPVAVGERSADEMTQYITREGDKSDECGIMINPLTEIRKPAGR